MLQLVDLRLDLRRHLWITVSDPDGEDPAEKVEISVPLDVPNVLHGRVVGDQRLTKVVRDRRPDEFLVLADDLFTTARGCLGRCHLLCSLPVVSCSGKGAGPGK